MARVGELMLLYDAAKVNIGPMNVSQQKTDKATQYHHESPMGTLTDSHDKQF